MRLLPQLSPGVKLQIIVQTSLLPLTILFYLFTRLYAFGAYGSLLSGYRLRNARRYALLRVAISLCSIRHAALPRSNPLQNRYHLSNCFVVTIQPISNFLNRL